MIGTASTVGVPTGWRRARTSSVMRDPWVVQDVVGQHRPSVAHGDPGGAGSAREPDADVPAGPQRPRQGEGHQVACRTVGAVQGGDAGVEEPADTLDDSFRDLVRVQRLRDDAADLGEALGGSPSALGFLEEAGVLDRDAGLVGQVGREREHVAVECDGRALGRR